MQFELGLIINICEACEIIVVALGRIIFKCLLCASIVCFKTLQIQMPLLCSLHALEESGY